MSRKMINRPSDRLTKAAEQDHAEAQLMLGMMYHEGKGVPQDYKQAANYFTKAAEQGYAAAQL